MAASETATVAALKTTVRPAVSTVRTTASSVSPGPGVPPWLLPRRSSSRNRETTNRL